MKIFEREQRTKTNESAFDFGHDVKLSLEMGKLVPILLDEVLPGDRWKNNSEIFLRMAPMIAPIMHRVDVYTHFFFVPNRIIWDEWEEFITGGEDGLITPVMPMIPITTTNEANFRASMLCGS